MIGDENSFPDVIDHPILRRLDGIKQTVFVHDKYQETFRDHHRHWIRIVIAEYPCHSQKPQTDRKQRRQTKQKQFRPLLSSVLQCRLQHDECDQKAKDHRRYKPPVIDRSRINRPQIIPVPYHAFHFPVKDRIEVDRKHHNQDKQMVHRIEPLDQPDMPVPQMGAVQT